MSYAMRRALSEDERLKLPTLSPLLAHLLFHRGITSAENAEKFLNTDYDRDTHDPFLLKDAEKAAERVIRAIQNDEKIAIYADYDADGIPGAAMWSDFMKRIGFSNFVIYIPHRHDEGFGVNKEAVEELAGQGVKLLITIDCGITDVEPVAHASGLHMDVIITDHHEPPVSSSGNTSTYRNTNTLPPAFAVIDHKQDDCSYPDKNICGSAVAFKLIQAVLKKMKMSAPKDVTLPIKDGHEKWLLDLVGIATLSDMVPLTGENRVFAHYGLEVLRKSPRKGIRKLLEKLKINQRHINEDDIAFMVTPRLNAASRMGVPMDAYDLLAADNDSDAYRMAEHLDAVNNERKGVVASLVREVKKTIKERYGNSKLAPVPGESLPSVIVLGNPSWRPSLLGLAANSCAEEFDRPVFLWGRDGDHAIKGSCRSEGRTHVVELMRAVPTGVLTQFGGHRHSGGFAVANDAVHFLEQRLNEAARDIERLSTIRQSAERIEKLKDSNPIGRESETPLSTRGRDDFEIDMELSLDEISDALWNDISKLAPFGAGNHKPVFLFKKVVPTSVRRFGKGSDHIELAFKKGNGDKVSAISFFGASSEWAGSVKSGMPIDLVASVEKSMYRDRAELRLRVVDVIYS